MKHELSLIDLHFIVKELQPLIGSVIDKIFQYEREVYFRLHSSSFGKNILVVTKSLIFLSSKKKESEVLHGFCAFLRKHLSRAKIHSIEQLACERIVKIVWDHKVKYVMYIELFNKGNIILCDENNTIIGLLEKQLWENRTLLPKESYKFAPKTDIFSLSEKDF